MTDSLGCTATAVTQIVALSDCDETVYIPNVFTPNNDGVNDVFRIVGVESIARFVRVSIFDRWGGLLYETTDPFFEWDGNIDGAYVNPGVYVYLFEYECREGDHRIESGDITVLR